VSEVSFEQFIQLVEFDQASGVLEKERAMLRKKAEEALVQIAQATQKLEDSEARLRKAKLDVKEKEAHMQELDARQREKERQLDQITNHREYKALASEIESLKKEQHTYEPELVQSWNALETATKESKTAQQEIRDSVENLQAQVQQHNNAIAQLSQKLEERVLERQTLLQGVPPELLEKYNAMRNKVANPIVPVINNSCSACFYTITQQTMNRLRMRSLEQCKGCFRFLYI
jgi:uncharacterized protein